MFLQSAQKMGFHTVALGPFENSPAAQVAESVLKASPDDLGALRKLAEQADAVSVEFENVSAPGLRWLAKSRIVRPGWRTIRTAQNRIREKTFLDFYGFPVAPWRAVRSAEDLDGAVRELGVPLILKTASSGYDGKGQIRVEAEEDAAPAWRALREVACVAEAVVSFAAEVSCVASRGADGECSAFPICLNRHERHILDSTICPAPVGPVVSQEARNLAIGIAEALGTVGVLTVEFFLTAEGSLLVNELAPRPHNSGHLTIEAGHCSQFDQQVRALAGLPLGRSDLVSPTAMVNLLGDLWNEGEPEWESALAADSGVHLHLYGKKSAKPGRKMGHLTVLDRDPESALARAIEARRRLTAGRK
jgi:5-(carboxyamino)imidazole ribonucleotide synthase